MSTVVLGAAGAIGSHVVEALLARGEAVRAVTRTPVGRVHHLPVGPPHTQQELADAFARAAGRPRARLSALPRPLHQVLAVLDPVLRELLGTRYQLLAPFVVDEGRFRREVADLCPVPLAEAAAATVAWFRARPA